MAKLNVQVRCADCGFLTYLEPATRKLPEVDLIDRAKGITPLSGRLNVFPWPRCFVHAFDLTEEAKGEWANFTVGESDLGIHDHLQLRLPALHAFSQQRDCDEFIPHLNGFSPREHLEARDKDRMQKRQDEQEDRRHQEFVFVGYVAAVTGVVGTLLGAVVGAILTAWLSRPAN